METNKLVLGTVQFGLNYGINNSEGKPSFEKVVSILDTAHANNIRLLDTAEAYGNAHQVIGQYHAKTSKRFQVISKYSATQTQLPHNLIQRVKLILEELRIEALYGYMFHSFKDFKASFKNFENHLLQLKKEGLVKKIGVSVYTNEEFNSVMQVPLIELIQLPFNLLDNQFQRGELLKKAADKGIEVHTRSVFLQGLFFKNPNSLNDKLKQLGSYLDTIQRISLETKLDVNALALAYAINQSTINAVLVGVDSVEQLMSNIRAGKNRLHDTTMEQINAIRVNNIDLLNPSNWN